MNKFPAVVRSPRAALAGLALTVASASSHAAVDQAITTALETAKTDGMAIGAAVLVVLVAIMGFKYIRRAL